MLQKNWRATCFATLLQKELNIDVARIATHVRTCISTSKVTRFVFLGRGGKTRNIAIQLVLQRSCKTTCDTVPLLTTDTISFWKHILLHNYVHTVVAGRGGVGGIEDSFIRVGSAPRSSPLLQPFMIEKTPLPYTFHWKIVPLSHIYLGTLHLFSRHQTGLKKKYPLKFRRGCKIYRKCNPHSWFRSLFEAFVQIVKFKVRKREQNRENLDNINRIEGYWKV